MSETLDYIQLSELAEISMGQSPDSSFCNSDEKGLPFLQGCAEFGRINPSSNIYCSPPLRRSKPDSLLISVRAPVGKLNWSDQEYCIGRGLGSIKAKQTTANTQFLKYAIEVGINFLYRRSQGSTFLAIGAIDLHEFPIPNFSFPQQRKIARILQTIDRAIESTQALIEKYQLIKAGLMHDLFTRGIGADGKLRPPREEAPELYQETAIGWIPKKWEVKNTAELCSRICVGIVIQPSQYYVTDGVPAFRSANIQEDGIKPDNLVYISRASNELLIKSQIKEKDILSVRTGYPGTSAVVPKEFEGSNCIDILISTPNNLVISEYLCCWINSSFGKSQVLRQQGGMAQQHFNVGEMRQLLVALPKLEEQKSIYDRLQKISERIQTEARLLEKLRKQKAGLMHDLLTGKVQVKVDDTEVNDA